MSTEIHNCQSLSLAIGVVHDLRFVLSHYALNALFSHVLFLMNFNAFESILFYVAVEVFNVLLNCREVCEALYFRVAVCILHCPADGRVVDVTDDEALPSIRSEVRYDGLFRFALHDGVAGMFFVEVVLLFKMSGLSNSDE